MLLKFKCPSIIFFEWGVGVSPKVFGVTWRVAGGVRERLRVDSLILTFHDLANIKLEFEVLAAKAAT